jgi:glutamate-1-semialdehyde 2,1-aminomutase
MGQAPLTATVPFTMSKSQAAFEAAKEVIPGGVNSPARAFRGVGGQPVFLARGAGSHVWDIDGNEYVDYVLSWGPLILGHAQPDVIEAVKAAAELGTTFGAPTLAETELATVIREIYPVAEQVRLVSSGTEATMSALRLARAFTGRAKIIKFSGCYHGHADMLLVQAGSAVATLGLPDSPGVTPGAAGDTVVARYNDPDSVDSLFKSNPDQIAGIIVEPVAGNLGVVPPEPGFLEGLRQLATEYGALLIFDEVLCGFRVALGGAVAIYGVNPDIITFGKVVGGGLPLAAYAGRRDIMQTVAPAGPMYQAGTLSGNPVAVAAGLTTLRKLREPGVFDAIATKTRRLITGFRQAAESADVPVYTTCVGTLGCVFFTSERVTSWDEASRCDPTRFGRYFHSLLNQGIYTAPSQYEAIFLSSAHSDEEIDRTITAAQQAMIEAR